MIYECVEKIIPKKLLDRDEISNLSLKAKMSAEKIDSEIEPKDG